MTTGTVSLPTVFAGWRARTIATAVATAAAVVLPQMFHLAGAAAGAGPAFAQAWLPMFLPVVLVGLLAGPGVGALVGLAAPLIAFGLTGMPTGTMLALVIIELIAGGVVAGLVATRRLPLVVATLAVVGAAPVALLLARGALGLATGSGLPAAAGAWWAQVSAGTPGWILQLFAVGIALVLMGRRRRGEEWS